MAAEELGSVGKAPAGDILVNKKAYVVIMVQPAPGAPDGFEERYNAYWDAVDTQVSQLEAKAGTVSRIFAEGVIGRGDDATLMVQQTNPGAHRVVRQRLSAGAVFEDLEETDLFGQVLDWGRCLQMGLISQTVVSEIQQKYTEVAEKRTQHMQQRLTDGIQDTEAALILTGDPNLTLPEGVEKFIVSPPELDELERWVQQANEAIRQQMAEEQARAQQGGAAPGGESAGGGSNTDSGLWTPG